MKRSTLRRRELIGRLARLGTVLGVLPSALVPELGFRLDASASVPASTITDREALALLARARHTAE